MQETSLVDQWLVIYRRKWQVLVVMVFTVLTTVIMSRIIPPVYEASLIFYPPFDSPQVTYLSPDSIASVTRDTLLPLSNEETLAPYIGILKSKTIAERVSAEYPEMGIAKLLRSNMDFEVTNEYMTKIYGRANDPQLAADITNAYYYHLNFILNEVSLKRLESDYAMLQGQLDEMLQSIEVIESELVQFELENNLANLDQAIAGQYETHNKLVTSLDEARVQLKEIESSIAGNDREISREEKELLSSVGSVSTPLVDHLRIQLSEVSKELATASIELGPLQEDIIALKTQREEIEQLLADALKSVVEVKIKPGEVFSETLRQNMVAAMIERDVVREKIKALQEAISDSEEKLNRFPKLKVEWKTLVDKIDSQKADAEQVRMNLREMDLQKARVIEHLVLVDPATPPQRPAFPFMPINIFVSLIVGILGGLFYAFFIDYVSQETVKSTRKLALEIHRGVRN